MKLYEIDNFSSKAINKNALIKGKKIIYLPEVYEKIISTGGYIPHITINNVIHKYCHSCKNWRMLALFIKNKYAKDGYKDCCSDCDNKRRRKRYAITKAVT